MGASNFVLTGSRIANGTRTWQANENVDVTDWTKSNPIIFAAMVETTKHAGASATLELRWRNVTDAGSFAALSSSGELTWSATTDLVNDNAVTSGEAGCTPTSGTTYVDGVEREGANSVSPSIAQNEYTENQWAIDFSNALDTKQYEFEIYDTTEGASLGTCQAQITTETVSIPGDANPDGVGSTGSNGTATTSGDANITATGQESTAQLGDETTAVSTEPEGQEATSAFGTATAYSDGDASVTGQEGTSGFTNPVGAGGTAALISHFHASQWRVEIVPTTGDAEATPDGVGSTSAVGSVYAGGGSIPAGQEATSTLGDAVATGDGNIVATGQEATATQGDATATGDGVIVATGQEASSTLGTAGAGGGAIVEGQSATPAVGTADATGDAEIVVTGQEATAELGDVVATGTGDAEALPEGVDATSAVGTAAASGDANITATGQESTSTLGDAYAGGGSVPAGQEATSELGTATVSAGADITATGQEATSELGDVVATGESDAEALPDGVTVTAAVGTAVATGSNALICHFIGSTLRFVMLPYGMASPLGVEATADVGSAFQKLLCQFSIPTARFYIYPVGLIDTAYPEGVVANADVPSWVETHGDGNAKCYFPEPGFRALDGQDGFLAPESGPDGFYAPVYADMEEAGPYSTASVGTAQVTGVGGSTSADVNVDGVLAQSYLGEVTLLGVVNIAGVEATAYVGGLDGVAQPDGVEATAQLGTVDVSLGASPLGVEATAALGLPQYQFNTIVQVAGIQANAVVGVAIAVGADANVLASGVYVDATVGVAVATGTQLWNKPGRVDPPGWIKHDKGNPDWTKHGITTSAWNKQGRVA